MESGVWGMGHGEWSVELLSGPPAHPHPHEYPRQGFDTPSISEGEQALLWGGHWGVGGEGCGGVAVGG